MKKNELQKILKPLIKECIKEVIFEEGILSSLISEVVQALGQQTIVEAKQQAPKEDFSRQRVQLQSEARDAMTKRKKKLEESLGGGFAGIFESVDPISQAGTSSESNSQSPLSGYAPSDPGVDISAIMQIAGGQNWKDMI